MDARASERCAQAARRPGARVAVAPFGPLCPAAPVAAMSGEGHGRLNHSMNSGGVTNIWLQLCSS